MNIMRVNGILKYTQISGVEEHGSMETEKRGSLEVNASSLPVGVYFVRVSDGNSVVMKKIIKQ